jgi:uncharacterized protein (DUF2336 family)
VVPNGPEHEQTTPIVTGDPDAAAAVAEAVALPPELAGALVAALAGGELLLLLLDEHAPTETRAVRTAAVTATDLRRRTI